MSNSKGGYLSEDTAKIIERNSARIGLIKNMSTIKRNRRYIRTNKGGKKNRM